MGLKKRSKVSAEFSMSSLTDIIFLLLIFFMLTSSLVAPNSLNLKLPGKNTKPTTSKEKIDDVSIDKRGRFYLNGKQYDVAQLERTLASNARKKRDYTITMSPESGTPTEYVAKLMDISLTYNINGILATELK